jgi:uncharacterized membrane protein
VLMPATVFAMIPVLIGSYGTYPKIFSLYVAAFVLFIVALVVTVLVEVPLVKEIVTWTVDTLPPNWQQLRDRWVRFHIIRVVAGLASLAPLLIAAIFRG